MPTVEQKLDKIEERLRAVELSMATVLGASNTQGQLLKYVVTPLLIILGALVGIKLA